MQRKRNRCAAIAVAGLLALGAALPALAQTQEVKLGFAAPLSGTQARDGKEMENGIQLAIDQVNASKPVIGSQPVKFMLDAADDKGDPRRAVIVAQRLVDDDIQGMLGHLNADTTILASRIYAAAGIPEIAMTTAPAYTEQGFNSTFRMQTTDTQQGSVLGRFVVKQLRFKRIAIVDDQSTYGRALADEFEKAAKGAGARIVRRDALNRKASDYRVMLGRIKRERVNAIFYGGAEAPAALLVKQMRELGVDAPLVAGEALKSDSFLQIAGKAANGTIASTAGVPLDRMPGGAGFERRYRKRFGAAPGIYAPYAYDGAMAMMSAMKRANSTAPAKFLPALAATQMPGVTARTIAYDAHGNLKYGTITVYKAVDGQWQMLQTAVER